MKVLQKMAKKIHRFVGFALLIPFLVTVWRAGSALFASFVYRRALKAIRPEQPFETYPAPLPPDYTDIAYWAALPAMVDYADVVPANTALTDEQMTAPADVFFVHPTLFLSKSAWNADPRDQQVNQMVDKRAIKNQASVFNGSARVYAPRYRQATFYSFIDVEDGGLKAREVAYGDVRDAFLYYLEHFNGGRPLIIAGHSQGSWHALRLLEEYFEGKPLARQLVAAYIVGVPLPRDKFSRSFRQLVPCRAADQTGCIITWNTYGRGGNPSRLKDLTNVYYATGYESNRDKPIYCVNPLTWSVDEQHAGHDLSLGGAVAGPDEPLVATPPGLVDARCRDGILWIDKPRDKAYKPSRLPGKSYHVYDYSLFYLNIRENVRQRVEAYLCRM